MLNVSIVTRWIIYIIPTAGILWIPAILQFTKNHNAMVSNAICSGRLLGFTKMAGIRGTAPVLEYMVYRCMGWYVTARNLSASVIEVLAHFGRMVGRSGTEVGAGSVNVNSVLTTWALATVCSFPACCAAQSAS